MTLTKLEIITVWGRPSTI